MSYTNIAAYKFVTINDPESTGSALREECERLEIKGTILIAGEGLNIMLAGAVDSITSFVKVLRQNSCFTDMEIKYSESDIMPFWKLRMKVKNEIIRMNCPDIVPENHTAPRIAPKELQAALDAGEDIVLLDTRNDYEIAFGTFEQAIDPEIKEFSEWPEVVKSLPEDMKGKKVVTFCTGGVRCEKAAAVMENEGFTDVYQLDGGILRYFEETGGAHWDGACYVFDGRVAVGKDLEETNYMQCAHCNAPITDQERPGGVRAFIPCKVCEAKLAAEQEQAQA